MKFRRKEDIKELKLLAEAVVTVVLCVILLAGCLYLYSEGSLPPLEWGIK